MCVAAGRKRQLRKTASRHAFRIPPSAYAFLVCIIERECAFAKNREKHAQNRSARFDERSVLHAYIPIPKEVACGLRPQRQSCRMKQTTCMHRT